MATIDFIPKLIQQIINDAPHTTVTAARWNELFNLLITQGDYNSEIIQALVLASAAELDPMSDFKYIRLSEEGFIEVSLDGEVWQSATNYGHQLINSAGNPVIARNKLKFVNFELTDDGVQTILQAIGHKIVNSAGVEMPVRYKLQFPNATITDVGDKTVVQGEYINNPYKLIQSYTEAGTYTFTAQDLAKGRSYWLYACIIGAGGSGSASKTFDWNLPYTAVAQGGASGLMRCIKLLVIPGNTYAVVVGAGGAPAGRTGDRAFGLKGNAGGSSSFNGITVTGGAGGSADAAMVGGQTPDGALATTTQYATAPAYGVMPYINMDVDAGDGKDLRDGLYKMWGRYCEYLNIFDMKRYLGAGGNAYAIYNSSVSFTANEQPVLTLDDGLHAGAGKAYAGVADVDVYGNAATSPGCGGGGTASVGGEDEATALHPVYSGAGADGAVFIYAAEVI